MFLTRAGQTKFLWSTNNKSCCIRRLYEAAKSNWYIITVKNTLISPNFLVWKFCGKAQFLHSFGRFARNYAETVPFHKNLCQEIR